MKKPIATFSTDWHIKDDNANQIIDLVIQQCKLNKKLGVKYIICLGDVFTAKIKAGHNIWNTKSLTQIEIETFDNILTIIKKNKQTLISIVGNHDKSDGDKEYSFLNQFRHHPNFHLISGNREYDIVEGVRLNFISYFKDEVWLQQFKQLSLLKDGINILCSHRAFNGSVNNDGSKVEETISPKVVSDYKSVFLGHYHNQSKVGSNIFHLPSIQQNNFGEDEEKGFTVLYDDGSHELVKSSFKPFIKVKIDVNKTSKEEINNYINEYQKQSENAHIRFILEGNEEILKSINKEKFLQAGIDVKTKSCEIGVIEDFDTVEITKYNDENIIEEFEMFCEEKGLDFNEGVKYLK